MIARNNMNSRPVDWATKYRKWPRVAFISHALLPGYLSTDLISERLKSFGREWPVIGEDPRFIRWFSFPVVPRDKERRPVWVDFYIIPLLADDPNPDRVATFRSAVEKHTAYNLVSQVANTAIRDAAEDGVAMTIGWGAATKIATSHGKDFLHREGKRLPDFVSTTHGDAGTAAIVINTLVRASFVNGARVAIIGANGAIGDVVSRAVTKLQPSSILLVGRRDKTGSDKLQRLLELQGRVVGELSSGSGCEVFTHQDKSIACNEHHSDVVVVATHGMHLEPGDIPGGAVVLDMTTPSACEFKPEWSGRMVLTAGCGQFDAEVIPNGFGMIGNRRLDDIGAGGNHVIWGCTGETIARACAGWRGHVVGDNIPPEELDWCANEFPRIGFHPQPPVSFGRPLRDWSTVRHFVCRSSTTCSFPQMSGGSQ